jgi:hypothetical protein
MNNNFINIGMNQYVEIVQTNGKLCFCYLHTSVGDNAYTKTDSLVVYEKEFLTQFIEVQVKGLDYLKTEDAMKIIEIVAKVTGVSYHQMLIKTRKHEVSLTRQLAMYFINNYINISVAKLADLFLIDRATVYYSLNKIESLNNKFNPDIERLCKEINNKIILVTKGIEGGI